MHSISMREGCYPFQVETRDSFAQPAPGALSRQLPVYLKFPKGAPIHQKSQVLASGPCAFL